MCAFNVLLTCDTTDLHPMTEPSTSPTCTEALRLCSRYILDTAESWHLNFRAVVRGHCSCMDQRGVNMVTRPALDLLLHAGLRRFHATEFPYQNNTSKKAASGTNKVWCLIRTGKNVWLQFEERIILRQGHPQSCQLCFTVAFYLFIYTFIVFCFTFCGIN